MYKSSWMGRSQPGVQPSCVFGCCRGERVCCGLEAWRRHRTSTAHPPDRRSRAPWSLDVTSRNISRECGEHRRAQRLRLCEVGRRERLGKLNGGWRDVVLLERRSLTIGIIIILTL